MLTFKVVLLLLFEMLVRHTEGQSVPTPAVTSPWTPVPGHAHNVTAGRNESAPNTTASNATSAGPMTAPDAQSTSRMVILIVVSALVVFASGAIWVMWRRRRRDLPPRGNGQGPGPVDDTEDFSTVLQNPGFVSGNRETEQLSGLPIRLSEDENTVYHELDATQSQEEQLMDDFYPIEIPEDVRR